MVIKSNKIIVRGNKKRLDDYWKNYKFSKDYYRIDIEKYYRLYTEYRYRQLMSTANYVR